MSGHVTVQDKADLAHLNDRLAGYMQRMRQLSKNAGDPGYKEALAQLESEMARVRDTYEKELDRLRGNLEAANRDRNALQQTKNRLAETEGKLNDETNRGRKAIDDVQSLHRTLADREKEIAGLRALVQERDAALNHLRPAFDKLEKQVADLTRQLDDESRRRQAADAALKKLQDKLAFDAQSGDDQKRELENRLRAAHDIINNLEAKMRGKGEDAIQQALQKLRDQQASDLKRFQQEADDKLQRALAGVKGQLDEDGRKREALQRENAKLNDIVQQLQAQLRDLENQHNGCVRARQALEDALNQEKLKAHNTIKDLERKLREHQDAILAKIQECNHARDLSVALKQEIESYRALLDGEERRLGAMTASGHRQSSPMINGSGTLPKIGATNGMAATNGSAARNSRNKIDVTTYRRDYCA